MQPDNFSQVAPAFVNSSTAISNFNISLFASEVGLGDPVAGNFFFTGPDASSVASSSSSAASSSGTASSGNTSGALGKSQKNWITVVGLTAVLGALLL